MPRLYLQARSQIWTMQTHEEIDGGFTMNAFESFIYEILDFAENANNVGKCATGYFYDEKTLTCMPDQSPRANAPASNGGEPSVEEICNVVTMNGTIIAKGPCKLYK